MHEPIVFPAFQSRPLRRLLAYLDGDQIITENEQRYTLHTLTEMASLLYQERLLLFVSSLSQLSDETLDYLLDRSRVWCTKHGDPVSAQFNYTGGSTRWITSSTAWGYQKPTINFLQTLRHFYEIMEIGVANGPGGAGLAKLRSSWISGYGLNWKAHRHVRPNQDCCQELSNRGLGARSDVLTTETFDWAWEIDRKNAYGADLASPLPTGAPTRFLFGMTDSYKIWVGACTVQIEQPLYYGLFPMRGEDDQLYYPTQPGTYQTWLWSNQVALLQRHNLTVSASCGWGWYETTTDCAAFVAEMERLRDENPHVADLIKLSLVASIGRLGMDNIRYYLSKEGNDETDIRVCLERRATTLFLKKEIDYKPQSMPHWYWYVMALACEHLTEQGYLWAKQEMLIATNTDAVILRKEADVSSYPSKQSSLRSEKRMLSDGIEELNVPSGEWRVRRLNKITVPALRHLLAETETGERIDKRPGLAYPINKETGERMPRKRS